MLTDRLVCVCVMLIRYGPYTSGEGMSYSVSSSWLRREGESPEWLAGGELFLDRFAGLEWENATFSVTNETQMRSKMTRSFKHDYYDAARLALEENALPPQA